MSQSLAQEMFKKIKKRNGERFAQCLRNHHSGLLEIPDIDVIVYHAGRRAEGLLPYLMTLLPTANDNEPVQTPKYTDPFELLDRAGYNAFYADTHEKQNSIKPYFKRGELLCTFNDHSRFKHYHIVHAVKKDVDQIKRKDFKRREQRQDAYGTSVISIQMRKKGGFISIKNRYNHSVPSCDNTFDSNPDNIIDGLSYALQTHFDVDFTPQKSPLPDNFTIMGQQIFKYNTEDNNIYYGDQAWVRDGKIHTVDKSAGDALFDQFIFRSKTKTLEKIDPRSQNSFADDFNRFYGGNPSLNVQKGNLALGEDILIGAEQSRLTSLYLPAFTEASDYCLCKKPFLKNIDVPNLKKTGRYFLYAAHELININIPKLESIENNCLNYAPHLKDFIAPKLKTMGQSCFRYTTLLKSFDTPELEEKGEYCILRASHLVRFNAPKLKKIRDSKRDDIMNYTPNLREFNAQAAKDAWRYRSRAAWNRFKHRIAGRNGRNEYGL